MARPLQGVKVLDFSTLLPGPVCSLILAEAGAEVIKIERPGAGDEMRTYVPRCGADSVNFALLNRGKRSIAIDLKDPQQRETLMPLIREADVVLEQFRPGVMDRLGLGYDALAAINPGIVYCAITGYGQHGPRAMVAAHDLNYVSESGMLSLVADASGAPVLPPALIADIAGGAYPAVINILLALRERDRSGRGAKLDISMSDNLFTFLYWAIGEGTATGDWATPGSGLVAGASPRYQIYRTADDKFLAAAPLEQKFWENFCRLVEVPETLCDDAIDPQATRAEVARLIAARTAAQWQQRFEGHDVCCTIVASMREAINDPHFKARGLFTRRVLTDTGDLTAVPVPVVDAFRGEQTSVGYPRLGEHNALLHRESRGE